MRLHGFGELYLTTLTLWGTASGSLQKPSIIPFNSGIVRVRPVSVALTYALVHNSSVNILEVGTQAPDFTIKLGTGDTFTLSHYRGRNVVLFFYPMAFSPGCSAQVEGFCESYGDISKWNAEVIGISANKLWVIKRFTKKMQTPFPMGSDSNKEVSKLYGAERLFGLITSRMTYVIDGDGTIRGLLQNEFGIDSHLEYALQTLESLS